MKSIRMTMRTKLFIVFMLSILFPILMITFFTYRQSAYLMEDKGVTWQINALNQAEDSLNSRIETIGNLYTSFMSNEVIYRLISGEAEPSSLSQQLTDIKAIENLVIGMESNSQILKMRIYMDNAPYAAEKSTLFPLQEFMETPAFQKIIDSRNRIYFSESYSFTTHYGTPVPAVSAYVAVRSLKNFDNFSMVLELVIDENYFVDMLDSLVKEVNANAFLVNRQGEIMLRSHNSSPGGVHILEQNFSAQTQVDWMDTEYDGKTFYFGSRRIDGTQWTLYFILPELKIIQQSTELRRKLLIALLLCLGCMALVVLGLSRLITRRLGILRDAMRSVQQGNLHITLRRQGNDEISDLQDDFLYMLDRIQTLLEEKNITLEQLRTQELNALHSNINPHFLYNSLDLINWLAFEKNAPEIQKAVSDLARFYKVSLSKGETLIRLRDELTHVTMYTNIQNLRYDNAVDFTVSVPEACMDCYIPKITLQPIVENALLHGIMQKPGKTGKIAVTAFLDESADTLSILIEDDGSGFGENPPSLTGNSEQEGGYGLSNVNIRLQMYFGEDYGISFPSPEKAGARVLVKIRAVKSREELLRIRNDPHSLPSFLPL